MALHEGDDVEHGLARALRHAVGLVAAVLGAAPERYRQVSKHLFKSSSAGPCYARDAGPSSKRLDAMALTRSSRPEPALHPPQFPRRDTCAVRGLSATRKRNSLDALQGAHLKTRPSLAPPNVAALRHRYRSTREESPCQSMMKAAVRSWLRWAPAPLPPRRWFRKRSPKAIASTT